MHAVSVNGREKEDVFGITRKLFGHVIIHVVVCFPFLFSGIDVEPCSRSKIPIIVLFVDICASWAGVRADQSDASLLCIPTEKDSSCVQGN